MARPRKTRGRCTAEGCGQIEAHAGLCGQHYRLKHRRKPPAREETPLPAWKPEAIAWIAGLLEGRGYFRARNTNTGRSFFVRLQTADSEIALGIKFLLGIGTVSGPYHLRRSYCGEVWHWTVARQQHVRALCLAIHPWMSSFRREQIDKLLSEMPERELVSTPPADPSQESRA